ncbi:MAG TPA: enoyl-CoA hydratase/isomerase family protein [Acidimicrobiales bacterium]|nr:enoyl-CoA hydratase/isomerase family protein [Acidimicrobiales bacterium]
MNYERFSPALLVEERGPVRIITMNKPEQLNSMSDDLHHAIGEVWHELLSDHEARVVVLTGAGRAFCTGGYMANFIRSNQDPVMRRRDIRQAEHLAKAMIDCDLPIVAAVNGPAVGLGCSLAVMSDIVLMADDAWFADTHVNVGLVAGDGGAVSWPLMMSLLKAKEYIFLGDRIPAADAVQLGLANRVCPPDRLMEEALLLAGRLAEQPQQALRDTKRALNKHLEHAAGLVLSFALAAETESFGTEDVRKIAEGFLARKKE